MIARLIIAAALLFPFLAAQNTQNPKAQGQGASEPATAGKSITPGQSITPGN